MEDKAQEYLLKQRKHFAVLDGLRGIAALAVVIFHFMEIIENNPEKNIIAHGFLAVDFFFCLSGFVVAYAYDSRIRMMGISVFIKHRLIRLHPLIIIGSVLGLITFILDPFSHLFTTYGIGRTMMLFLTSALLIPYPVMEERYFNNFGLNAPMWSLFWEYIANLVYAIGLFKVGKKTLACLVMMATVFMLYTVSKAGTIGGGWSGDNFIDGLARIGYSFLIGMLIYRTNLIIKNGLNLWVLSVILIAIFLIPYSNAWNWIVEPLIVMFILPLIVSLGAGTTAATRFSEKFAKISGEISYPLYMTHYPFIWIFLTYVITREPSSSILWILVPAAVIILVLFAWLVYKYVDLPIRNYLNKL